jgi:hypothetical protein
MIGNDGRGGGADLGLLGATGLTAMSTAWRRARKSNFAPNQTNSDEGHSVTDTTSTSD